MYHAHDHARATSGPHDGDAACCLPPEQAAAGAACHAPEKPAGTAGSPVPAPSDRQ